MNADSIKAFVAKMQEEVLRLHDLKKEPLSALLYRSQAMDQLLVELYRFAESTYSQNGNGKESDRRFALIAQGGYGRKELCLHSDIDLLFLYEGKAEGLIRFLTEKVIQALWDSGLEVGVATRTVKDCRRLMEGDLTILTSLLDARLIVGDQSLFGEFQRTLSRYLSAEKNRERFYRLKMDENEERRGKYGDSIYLLEPNIKEARGGLRDFHTLGWIGCVLDGNSLPKEMITRGYLAQEEYDALQQAVDFLWSVRNELHRRSSRRVDQILFDHQEPVAQWMGFVNTPQFLGVEVFMQQYYRHAATIERIADKAIRRLHHEEPELFPREKSKSHLVALPEDDQYRILNGRLTIVAPDLFEKEPLALLKIFETARRLGVEIDDFAKEKIEKNLFRIDDLMRSSPEACALFRDMVSRPIGLGKMLGHMNDTGVLGAFLPEFEKLHFRVQHDIYHVYTVDVHSIFAVVEYGKLLEGHYAKSHPTLTQLVKDIERKHVLALAILYHDIGKGEGRGHVEKGAPLIRRAGERLGFSPAEVDILEFLERSHLIMTHLAFRRDLEDHNMIIQFAKATQNMDLLNMLYALTFCDVKAVSQEAMTDWKSSLVEYLYLKTREVIQRGAFTKERVSELVSKALSETLALLNTDKDREKCGEFFQMMAPRYLLATPPATIVRHVRLWEKFAEDPIVFESRSMGRDGFNEVILLTWESPTLFSRMTGLFASHNINILEAQLNLSSRGHSLQILKVTDPEGHVIEDADRWQRFEKDLRDVLQGRTPINTLVAEKFKPSLFKKKIARVLPSRVDIDNDLSAYYTVIDIVTHDRLGLLYQITSTLAVLGLYVDVSKISTKVDQVADTFYVKDIFGHKVTSEGRLKKVQAVLQKVIEEEPKPGWKPEVLIGDVR